MCTQNRFRSFFLKQKVQWPRSLPRYRTIFRLFLCTIVLFAAQTQSQPLANGKNKFLGNVIHSGYSIHSDFSNYWNQITPENAGKWGSVEGGPGYYTWTELDDIYNYAVSNGYLYKHHNLIWGSQYPTWITSLDSASLYQEIVNWIDSTGKRYPKADFCDVVNEPIHTPLPAIFKTALGGKTYDRLGLGYQCISIGATVLVATHEIAHQRV